MILKIPQTPREGAEQMGQRLQSAREDKHITREALCDVVNKKYSPFVENRKDGLSLSSYKNYEYGKNQIPTELIPVFCKELDFETGFLFGEHEEKRRTTTDMSSETGLSITAVENLRAYGKVSRYNDELAEQSIGQLRPVDILSRLLEQDDFWYLLSLVAGECSSLNIEFGDLLFERDDGARRASKFYKNRLANGGNTENRWIDSTATTAMRHFGNAIEAVMHEYVTDYKKAMEERDYE